MDVLQGQPAVNSAPVFTAQQPPPDRKAADEMQRMREDRHRLVEVNEQLVARLQGMASELQKYIDKEHPNAAHILHGTPGYTSPPNEKESSGNVKSKFFKFVDEVTEKRDLKEEVEVLRGRLMKLNENEAEVRALQIGLEVCQADYSNAVKAQHEAEKVAKRCEEETRILRESLKAYEGDAHQQEAMQQKATQDEEDLDELFGAEIAAKEVEKRHQQEAAPLTTEESTASSHQSPPGPAGHAVSAMIAELREKVLELQQTVDTKEEQLTKVNQENAILNQSIRTLNSDLRDVHKEKDAIEDQRDHMKTANVKLEEQLQRLLGVVNTAQEHESEAHALYKKIEHLSNEVRRLEGELEAERSCAHETASTTISFRKEIEDLKKQLDEKERTLSTTLISLETYEDQEEQLESTKSRVNKLSAELKTTRRDLEETTQQLLDSQKQLNMTKAMLRSSVPRLTRDLTSLQLTCLMQAQTVSSCRQHMVGAEERAEECEEKLAINEAEVERLQSLTQEKNGAADDAVRQVTLELRKSHELNRELKKQLMKLERQVEDQKALHAEVVHNRSHSALSDAGSGQFSSATPPVSSASSFHRDPHSAAATTTTSPMVATGDAATFFEKINHLEAKLKAVQDECDRKGDIITSIVAKHPEVLAGPYAPTLAQQKQAKAAHPLGFGKGGLMSSSKSKKAPCTPQEFANLQSVLEQTMVENMRLTKDADVLAAECGRLSDLLAKATASTKDC